MRALIFCAGAGTRLRPLTQIMPKPLVPVAGVPLVVRQIEALRRAGIEDVVLNVAAGAKRIQGALGDGSRFGVRLRYSVEGNSPQDALETRGGIRKALDLLTADGDEAFLAVAGDIVSDYDYARLVEAARTLDGRNRVAHLVLTANPSYHASGDMVLENGLIRCEADAQKLTFSSLGAYHAAIFRGVSAERARLFPWLCRFAEAGLVSGERFDGLWFNVGSLEELARAEAHFRGKP